MLKGIKIVGEMAQTKAGIEMSKLAAQINTRSSLQLGDGLPMLQVGLDLKNRKLLKSSKVRKWLKETERLINKKLNEESTRKKLAESVVLGVPVELYTIIEKTKKAKNWIKN